MPDDVVIRVQNLSKQYRIGAHEGYKTFRETLVDTVKVPFQRLSSLLSAPRSLLSPPGDTIWALKNVSFEVKKGEVLGIIGRNGAGKTTILKILSRITEPTEGRVELKGRVGSLLEVGTGFHPELTGHENIYLYGAILGMDRWEVTKKFDEIVAFAELEKFIDTPVKRYSSGMYMRLAFAVAAHMEPEVLLVDEVLAVGDAIFQRKCMDKMGKAAEGGRTVLFVSHNMSAVSSICQRGILLEGGEISFSGTAHETVSLYLDQCAETARDEMKISQRKDRTGSGEVRLTNFYIEDEAGQKIEHIRNGETVRLVFDYATESNREVENVDFQLVVLTQSGELVFQFGTRFTGQKIKMIPPKGKFICEIRKFPLVPGRYRLDSYLVTGETISDYIAWLTQIDVIDGDFYKSGYRVFEKESKFLIDASMFLRESQ
ncbi:MAG: ABC transporter ATP-binding protein [Proteobacteria bacterium]|nr:ABC transporter ATP-binding protein [Pseudomonadota bacterium]